MSLHSIQGKLNELVKMQQDKAQAKEPKEPTAEEKDEERLREIEAKLTDLMELISSDVTLEAADDRVKTAEERVESTDGEDRPLLKVFHDAGARRSRPPGGHSPRCTLWRR
jgi:hypothetical protein